MERFTSDGPPMDTAVVPPPIATTNGAAHRVNPSPHAIVPTHMMQSAPIAAEAEEVATRRHQAEEMAAIRLVHLLVTCAGAIQAGDYPAAHGNLAEAHSILAVIPTATGIGRVADHFAAALSERLFPAYPRAGITHPYSSRSATPVELHHHFYEAGPYIKFAYSTANLAILDALDEDDDSCSKEVVHVIDLAVMQGLQWAELIYALATRNGGPPTSLRITGIGPPPQQSGGRDELREVGFRLAELARSLNVPFFFRGVCADKLDEIQPWMLRIVRGETLVVNSVLQLHRLLVDPDADPAAAVPAPIDTVLDWVTGMRPRLVTVVEQEADHNRTSLLERFSNALFHYGAIFDSMEDLLLNCRRNRGRGGGETTYRYSMLAEAYLRAEIFDVVCGEGSARVERHEPLGRWRERLARAGLTQVPFGPRALRRATQRLFRLTSGPSSGYGVLACDGSLALGWHDRALYSVSAWRATGEGAAAAAAGAVNNIQRHRYAGCDGRNNRSGGESSGSGNRASVQGPAGETAVPY